MPTPLRLLVKATAFRVQGLVWPRGSFYRVIALRPCLTRAISIAFLPDAVPQRATKAKVKMDIPCASSKTNKSSMIPPPRFSLFLPGFRRASRNVIPTASVCSTIVPQLSFAQKKQTLSLKTAPHQTPAMVGGCPLGINSQFWKPYCYII